MKTLKNKPSVLSAAVSTAALSTKRSLILSLSPSVNDLHHEPPSPLAFPVVRKAGAAPESSYKHHLCSQKPPWDPQAVSAPSSEGGTAAGGRLLLPPSHPSLARSALPGMTPGPRPPLLSREPSGLGTAQSIARYHCQGLDCSTPREQQPQGEWES